MSNNAIDYTKEHYCPVYERKIHPDLCYDSLMCLNKSFKTGTTKELKEVENIEEARKNCEKCPYSEL